MDVVFQCKRVKGSPKRTEQPNDYFTPMLQFNTNMAARLQGVDWYVYTSIGVYPKFLKKMMYGKLIK